MNEEQLQEIKNNLRGIRLVDKILAPISLCVVVGWVIHWVSGGMQSLGLFLNWFQTLSFFSALAVAVIVSLRILGKSFLPSSVVRRTVAIASVVPIAGYFIEEISSLSAFLTIGGSIALAYFSATTYWRKHIPHFATDPLGESTQVETKFSEESLPDKTADTGGERGEMSVDKENVEAREVATV